MWMRENISRWANMIWPEFRSKSSQHLWSFLWQRLHRQWSLSLHFCDSEHIKLHQKAFLHLRDIQLRAAAIFHAPLTAIKHSRVFLWKVENCSLVDETKMHDLWLFCESWHSPVEAAVVGGQSQVGCFVREPGWHWRWELSSWTGDSFKGTELQWKWKWRKVKMWWNWLSI